MKIFIDRTHCDACQSYCDRHAARLVRFPFGEDRPCITSTEDDGVEELTLIVTDGDRQTTLKLDEQSRQIISLEGLSSFLQ